MKSIEVVKITNILHSAAQKAGMIRFPTDPDNGGSEIPIKIVLEPEAASTYCFNYLSRSDKAQVGNMCVCIPTS